MKEKIEELKTEIGQIQKQREIELVRVDATYSGVIGYLQNKVNELIAQQSKEAANNEQ